MKCPYCNQEMTAGNLYSVSGRAVYWFPQGKEYNGVVLSKSKIENQGGIVLDETTSVGFIAKNRPDSFWCKNCKVCITKL